MNTLLKSLNRLIAALLLLITLAPHSFAGANDNQQNLSTTKTHIKFFSSTPAEDIEAHNYDASSTINTVTGEVIFVVPMQSFNFDKSLMQRHFNQRRFLNTSEFPRARLNGRILNLSEIDFSTDGRYTAHVEGTMTIRGVENPIHDEATVIVENGVVRVETAFDITLGDYGISFQGGRPSTNVAKTVEVSVSAEYKFNQD
jgi:polyisoprenoid-binding protein YceI